MRKNLLSLVVLTVLAAVIVPRSLAPGAGPIRHGRSSGVHPGVTFTPQGLSLLNVNRVHLGMSRLQVQALFGGPPRDSQAHGYFQHFGNQPGFIGYSDSTEVHFNNQDRVSAVIGVNLAFVSRIVCTEAWGVLAPDPRRERVLAVLGKPDSISKVGEGEKWIYREPRLKVLTHPSGPWRFLLGDGDPNGPF